MILINISNINWAYLKCRLEPGTFLLYHLDLPCMVSQSTLIYYNKSNRFNIKLIPLPGVEKNMNSWSTVTITSNHIDILKLHIKL